VRIYDVPEPVNFARGLFVEALERAGVTVESDPSPTTTLEGKTIATLQSPPFSENARLIMKVSHNLHASTLPLLVAAKNGKRTLREGLELEHAFFKKAGLPVDEISFYGGAGGARADHVTPAATVALLRYMATRDDFAVYERALPIMGVDGTLANSVGRNSPAKGKVLAKTGTLYWSNGLDGSSVLTSKALAGYLTTTQDRRLAIAFYVNGIPLRNSLTTSDIGKDLGKLCEIVVEER
jgi:D-alanyl-D-alanine carboxypeptidase/D-alanyl-D-alanine-endopeptidase (penicillin-binding protein 4)